MNTKEDILKNVGRIWKDTMEVNGSFCVQQRDKFILVWTTWGWL